MGRRVIVLSVILIWYGIVGHFRVTDWTSEPTLWTRAVKVSPMLPLAHINRAKALYGQGRWGEAEQEVYVTADLESMRGQR